MALEQMKIYEIVKQAVSKNVDIPEFQRDFVWDPEDVKKLAESLYRDYPIGSFLLWDSSEYQESKTAQGTQASLWIVDGQQRTTALCLLQGMKPFWWDDAATWNKCLVRYDPMVNLLPDNGDERLEFALPNPIRHGDPRWVSVRRVLSLDQVEALTPLAQDIVAKITSDPAQVMMLFTKVHGRLQRLWQVRQREIPMVKITHEVEDVAEIFSRLNREGTRVREADVILALAAVRNPGWVRDDYLPFRNSLDDRGWDLDAGVFIRTMTAIGQGRARLVEVPTAFWRPDSLRPVWKKTHATISAVLKRLSEFGILSPDLLPSNNSLIPLFCLHEHWKDAPGYSFSQALRWFLLANRDGRYSGSAITSLNEDVRAIKEATDFSGALGALTKRFRIPAEVDGSEFLNRYDRAGNRFLRLMVYLTLFAKGAVDWVDGTRIGYDKTGAPVTTGYAPQWHHIFPRSILKAAGMKDDDINVLANTTVLNERTNVNRLSAKPPVRYISEFAIAPQSLLGHMIPSTFAQATVQDLELNSTWGLEHYADFVLGRAQRLAQETNTLLQSLDA